MIWQEICMSGQQIYTQVILFLGRYAGGSYDNSGLAYPTSDRGYNYASYTIRGYGVRVTLYL